MESIYLGIVIFLFLLAIFDLTVGVSNDAVNFLNSAIGAKAASFKTIILIAAVGIFCGATMSNGMMEIARHGIFRPEYTVTGNFHHPVTHGCSTKNTDSSNQNNRFKRGSLGTDSRIQEVYGVITDPYS